MPTIVSIYSMHAGCVLRLLNRTDCNVYYQKNLWVFMFEIHLISGITDEPPPAKPNVKTGPLRSLYFGSYYSFGFSRLFFLRFSECFPVISGFCIAVQYRVCYVSQLFSECWPVGSLQLSFSLAQTSSYITAPDQSKVVLQIRAMCRTSSIILQ